MKNGDHPVSNFCPSLNVASKKLLTTVHTFFPFFDSHVSTYFRNPIWTVEIRRTTWLYVKHEGYRVYTSDEAHNHSGLSVEKHSNNFVVSNDVLVLQVCKRCMDVVIVKKSYQGISMVATVVQHVH